MYKTAKDKADREDVRKVSLKKARNYCELNNGLSSVISLIYRAKFMPSPKYLYIGV